MQLSNEPAEELASMLIESGNEAFELCGFFAGGRFNRERDWYHELVYGQFGPDSEAIEGAIKLARQVSTTFESEISL